MHALSMLHRIFSTHYPAMHARRFAALLAAVEAMISGRRLTLSDLGRGIRSGVAVKHNIKRMDHLLGCETKGHPLCSRAATTKSQSNSHAFSIGTKNCRR